MSVFIGGPYGRLAIMLNMLSSLNIEIINIIIIIIISEHKAQTVDFVIVTNIVIKNIH